MVTINQGTVDEFLNTPFFSRMISDSGYKSVGIKVVDKNKVVQELTSSYDKKMVSFKKGIEDPDFIITLDYRFLKTLDKKKLEWIRNNPIKAYFKYRNKIDVPFFVKLKILSMVK